jgi:TatD DNase family protein
MEPITWVDTHLHLADSQYDADRAVVIQRALDAGVHTLIEIAESPDIWEAAVRLAEDHPFIYASLGIHPHHAHQVGPGEWPALGAKLRELLKRPKVVALGEFGLDYFRMRNTKEQQDYLFRQQLALAKEAGKPVVIHCRDSVPPIDSRRTTRLPETHGRQAHSDVQKIIEEFYPKTSVAMECPRPAGVVHCFSGAWSDAQVYLMHGFLVGIDAPVTYPKSDALRQVVLRLPLERIVLETDSPYLPPQSHRGQRNEPCHIPAIGEAVASVKHKTTDEVAAATTRNARALFRL